MAQVVVIRHAQADDNANGILMGSSRQADSHLSPAGALAAQAKGKELRASSFLPDKIYCSELNRTKETAQLIGAELGVHIPIKEMPELNERSFGQYERQPYEEILEAVKVYGHNPPTVEPADAFVRRVLQGLEAIKQEHLESVLVVTHSNPLAVIRCSLYHPDKLKEFWEFESDDHLEGLTFEY